MQTYRLRIGMMAGLALAFAFRVYALGQQSLWNDEGTSIALAARSLEAIADGAAKDIHPPLYYFLLHFWMPFAGESEFAVRFLSVVAGILVVAFTWRLASDLFGQQVGLIAAVLLALSPFQVYYSQETRMYIWVALWSTLSVWAMVRLVGAWELEIGDWRLLRHCERSEAIPNADIGDCAPPSEANGARAAPRNDSHVPTFILYLAATIAALYTHYFAPAVVLAENIVFAVWWLIEWRENRNRLTLLAYWLIGQLVIALSFLPWYLYAGNQLTAWPSISEPFDLPTLVWRVLNVFSVGFSLDGLAATVAALALGLLVLAGLLPSRDSRSNLAILLSAAWLLVPVGAMYVVSLSRPAYNPKFLLLATPPFSVLAARGLSFFRPSLLQRTAKAGTKLGSLRYSLAAIIVLATVGFVPSLSNYYTDPRYARDDYRAILRYVDTVAQPGDGILVDDLGQIGVVRYYHRGDQQLFLLPRGRPPEPAQTQADVDDMLNKVQRLFAVYYATEQSDPQALVETRLAEKAFKARDEWHGNVRLAVYGIAPKQRSPLSSLGHTFSGEIVLVGSQLDQAEARAGDLLTLTLTWRAEQTPSERYKVFVHLLDGQNRVVAQRDGEPVGDRRLTTTWRTGESISDNYGVLIDPETPPGEYRVEVGMYRADTGARLPITAPDGTTGGDHLVLNTVRIKSR